ncbi:MAG: carbohydrate binding domain-containing protein [Litorimonas sp.]
MLITRTALVSLLAASVMMVTTPVQAQDADAALQALDDALPGELLHNPFDLEWDAKGNDLKTKVIDAEAMSSGKAISARLKKKQPRAWDSNLSVQIAEAVSKGEEVQIFFYARTKKPAAGRETAIVSLFMGRNEEPYDYILSQDVFPSNEWELMNLSGTADADYPAGTLKVEYQLGKAAQTVEFGPVYVSTLGPKTSG